MITGFPTPFAKLLNGNVPFMAAFFGALLSMVVDVADGICELASLVLMLGAYVASFESGSCAIRDPAFPLGDFFRAEVVKILWIRHGFLGLIHTSSIISCKLSKKPFLE